jgi:Holliday junction resolvasome RuvABC DNA-binding subunit
MGLSGRESRQTGEKVTEIHYLHKSVTIGTNGVGYTVKVDGNTVCETFNPQDAETCATFLSERAYKADTGQGAK